MASNAEYIKISRNLASSDDSIIAFEKTNRNFKRLFEADYRITDDGWLERKPKNLSEPWVRLFEITFKKDVDDNKILLAALIKDTTSKFAQLESDKTIVRSYQILPTDSLIVCKNLENIVVTIASAAIMKGKSVIIKNASNFWILIKAVPLETIDGFEEIISVTKNQSITLRSDGVNWWII